MFTTIRDFLDTWRHESAATARVLAELTDASLAQAVAEGYRTLGELAWHVATSPRDIVGKTGLEYSAPTKAMTRPAQAEGIHAGYVAGARALAEAVQAEWTDGTLSQRDDVYGQSWPRGLTLDVMLRHEIHHRGQMTVLMRQAGLRVPGVYGPAKEG